MDKGLPIYRPNKMNPTLFPHRITETTEALALFACGYDPEFIHPMDVWSEFYDCMGEDSADLAAITAGVLNNLLDDDTNVPYLRIVN